MAKFVYQLQNILNLKYKLEEQAKNEYAIQKIHYEKELETLNLLREKKVFYEQEKRKQMLGTLEFNKIKIISDAIQVLEQKTEDQLRVVEREERKLDKSQRSMNEAMVERKTHEKLKDNAFDEFKKEVVAMENKEVDELVSYKYSKR